MRTTGKKRILSFFKSSNKSNFMKLISFTILIIFSTHLCILSSAFSLTLEEMAGKKARKPVFSSEDEFEKKTTARRAVMKTSGEKDPRLACLLSLVIPGGGQIYLKRDLKGIAFFSLTITGYSAAGYYLYRATTGDDSGAEKKSKVVISGLLFLLGVIFHTVGLVEAYNDAIEINEKKFYYGGNSKAPYVAELVIKQ